MQVCGRFIEIFISIALISEKNAGYALLAHIMQIINTLWSLPRLRHRAVQSYRMRGGLIGARLSSIATGDEDGGRGGASQVKSFLAEKGYPPNVAEGMMKAMPNASLHSFKQLGDGGLRALSGAVAREIIAQELRSELPSVTVVIVPFGRSKEEGLTFEANEGMTLYDLWEKNQSSLGSLMECACGGIAACSTCHVILEQGAYDALASSREGSVSEAEMDMLDLAEGPQATSRLGCQLPFKNIAGPLVLWLPESTNNLF